MTEVLKNDLFNHISAMVNEPDEHGTYCRHDDRYWVYDAASIPFNDFNKEICLPGVHPDFPEGALGIRADENFWQVGLLPYRFHELSMEDIAGILWPGRADCYFGEDVILNEYTLPDEHELG